MKLVFRVLFSLLSPSRLLKLPNVSSLYRHFHMKQHCLGRARGRKGEGWLGQRRDMLHNAIVSNKGEKVFNKVSQGLQLEKKMHNKQLPE